MITTITFYIALHFALGYVAAIGFGVAVMLKDKQEILSQDDRNFQTALFFLGYLSFTSLTLFAFGWAVYTVAKKVSSLNLSGTSASIATQVRKRREKK